MIWLIVPIVFVGAWIWVGIQEEDIFGGFLAGLAAAILAGLLCFGTCAVIECASDIEYEVAESKEISALVDNARFSHSVSGSVFLIQTRTDSTLKYSYMYYENGRGYAFDEVNAKSCYINYTDGTPRLDIYHPYFTNEFVRRLLGCPAFPGYDYVFYLPQDAEVIDSFVIDFE
ncbi:MAG: hypothetical protein J6R67_03220 [Treponema sp.]|nr:hypothetical protein [Treponema sp.]